MQVLNIVLVVLLSLSCVLAKKKQKLSTKKMKVTKADMDTVQPRLDKIEADLLLIENCLNTSRFTSDWKTHCLDHFVGGDSFSSVANEVPSGRRGPLTAAKDRTVLTTAAHSLSIGDMYLSGYSTKCGAQTITSWTSDIDKYSAKDVAGVDATVQISTSAGTFTAPIAGYYNICAFLRFKSGGNANDVTIYAGGSVVAGFGDAVDADWRSTGTCLIRLLAAGNTVYIRNNAGGGDDCVEETSWRYGRLAVYMVAPVA